MTKLVVVAVSLLVVLAAVAAPISGAFIPTVNRTGDSLKTTVALTSESPTPAEDGLLTALAMHIAHTERLADRLAGAPVEQMSAEEIQAYAAAFVNLEEGLILAGQFADARGLEDLSAMAWGGLAQLDQLQVTQGLLNETLRIVTEHTERQSQVVQSITKT